VKKVLIIAHFTQAPGEAGNNRFAYLANLLCENGYEVEVVSTSFSHKEKKQKLISQEACEKCKYKFTVADEPGYPKNVCLTRFYSHYVFGKNLKKYLEGIERPDVVYVAVPSNDAGVVAAEYCKKNNIPMLVDIQDLWPEAFKLVFNIPVVSDIVFAPMTYQANKVYAQADKIVAVSKTYAQRGLRNCKKDSEGTVVFLGTELESFDKAAQSFEIPKGEDELWVAYVGTLGHSYNIEIVIDALKLLPDELKGRVTFKVLGDGPLMERFQEHARESGVKVDFLGRREYGEMVAYLKKADIAVNPISKGAAQSIINKHGDYAMAGLPVVSTQESQEYRNLLTEYNCGINCSVNSVQEVCEALKELIVNKEKRVEKGNNSRRLGEEKFDRRQSYKELVKVIESF
jgi:glycosyltransferase involved in cell wall biosynthesis